MGRSRYTIQDEQAPHFLTCTVAEWLPIFANPLAAEIIIDSLAFLHRSERITLWAYVLMENHMHMIASADRLSQEVQAFTSFTAQRLVDTWEETTSYSMLGKLRRAKLPHKRDRMHQVWQGGSHPKILEGGAMIEQKIAYIHDNPVKRGYVDDPRHWRYSSARNYAGESGLIEVAVDW